MFSGIGKLIIDSITIFDDFLLNVIVTTIIGGICYLVSFRLTGELYFKWGNSSKTLGSLIHWAIRVPLFLTLSWVVRCTYYIYNFIRIKI